MLGPLEVRDGERVLALAGGRSRALLAALLVRRGEVVSADRLVDSLWNGPPPASALNIVHVHVSQLRKTLGDDRVETHGHGYRLRLDPEELDAERFERLLGRGRELLLAGRVADAVEALRQALGLWHGPALADFADHPFAQNEIARLEELRLSALEERIEAELALGRHDALIPELETLVREEPLRERPAAQLMLALYRAGRQAEALDVYRRFRRQLVGELGLEPGRRLQELERAILEQDPTLDAPAAAGSTSLRARRRGGLLIAIGGVLLLLATLVAAVLLVRGRGGAEIASVRANSVAAIDPRTNRVVADIPVGDGPTSIAVGGGKVWVLNRDAETISMIDAQTRALLRTFAVGATPADVAASGRSVWVGESVESSVLQLDPRSGAVVRTVPAPPLTPPPLRRSRADAGSVAVAGRTVWFLSGNATLSRISASSGKLQARIRHPGLPSHYAAYLAIGDGTVWVSAWEGTSGVLSGVDPRTNSIAHRVVLPPVGPIAVGFGRVWLAGGASVWGINAETGALVGTIAVAGAALDVAVGEGSVWVASGDGSVSRIDPTFGEVVRTIRVGGHVQGIAVGAGAVWAAVG